MYLGLDISKRYFDATLLTGEKEKHYRQFENSANGYPSHVEVTDKSRREATARLHGSHQHLPGRSG